VNFLITQVVMCDVKFLWIGADGVFTMTQIFYFNDILLTIVATHNMKNNYCLVYLQNTYTRKKTHPIKQCISSRARSQITKMTHLESLPHKPVKPACP
jgi:hypothetical protein